MNSILRKKITKMNNIIRSIIAVLLMIPYLMGSGGLTQTFSDGLSAYKANKYKMALEIWRPLAKRKVMSMHNFI